METALRLCTGRIINRRVKYKSSFPRTKGNVSWMLLKRFRRPDNDLDIIPVSLIIVDPTHNPGPSILLDTYNRRFESVKFGPPPIWRFESVKFVSRLQKVS